MVTAHLPGAGIRPATIVLVDPPYLTLAQLEALTREPTERPYDVARRRPGGGSPGESRLDRR